MRVAVPKEILPGETRVALVPESVGQLVKAGLEVAVEAGAGEAAGFSDEAYREAGATVAANAAEALAGAAVVLKVQRPQDAEADRIPEGATLIGFLQPAASADLLRRLAARRISAFAMELVPRITRAQKMDALSSQATVAGYKAALVGANRIGKFFPMLMTAAGTVPPARVLVLGAGVAGLQAIATARRLGAMVQAFDIRPAAKEQVESLGATFVGLTLEEAEDVGGYAKQVSEDVEKKEQELLSRLVADADVVITTAQVPGKPAPRLITAAMVEGMRPGSVIVDLAADTGGNCELTQAGKEVTHRGVAIIGLTNAAAALPVNASQMYSRNIAALLLHLVKDGALHFDFDDEITRQCCVAHAGEVLYGKPRTPAAAPGAAG